MHSGECPFSMTSTRKSFERLGIAAVLLLLAPTSLAIATAAPGAGSRLEAGGYIEGRAVAATEGGARQRPGALLDVRLDAAARPWLRTHLEFRSRAGGPFEGGHPGTYNFVHTFQNRSPSLEFSEVYADVRWPRADLRAGIQRLVWGKLDGIPPTDVVNPRDYHDPLVDDFEERKIGIPALTGTYYPRDLPYLGLSALRARLTYVPIAVPPRLALIEERWFPKALIGPSRVVVPKKVFDKAIEKDFMAKTADVPHDVVIPAQFRTLNHRPPKQLDAGGVAIRLGGTWREMDWDIYHYSGPETGPDAQLPATVTLERLNVTSNDHQLSVHPQLRALARIRQAHDVMHMTGADWSAAIGGATVRAEAAVFQDRPYLRLASDLLVPRPPLVQRVLHELCPKPAVCICKRGDVGCPLPRRARVPFGDLFTERDAVEWGIGADYLTHGFIPLVQLNQTVFTDAGPPLLIADPETRFSASVRKLFIAERLELELRGAYALEREYWFVFPRASYLVRDNLRVRLGYLAIGGQRESLLGQFRDNDEFVLEARFSF